MNNLKILIVDDDKVVLAAIKALLLEHYDCAVDIAEDVTVALNLLYTMSLEWQPKWYDLILMDINMPKIQGDLLTKVIRETEVNMKSTPIIAITGNASESQVKCFLEHGISEVLFKPITFEKIGHVIKKYLSPK